MCRPTKRGRWSWRRCVSCPRSPPCSTAFGGTLDRYITRQFHRHFRHLPLRAVDDLAAHRSERQDRRISARSDNILAHVVSFYATRSPAILSVLLPYSLLLALLYSLGKLSTNREIIAMIQSGRSVVRITLPLIVAGVLLHPAEPRPELSLGAHRRGPHG